MLSTECNKWLTVIEAAKHLNVTEVDIYTAALDGRLRLSFNFVNGATVRRAKLMSAAEVEVTCSASEFICGPFWGRTHWGDGDWLKIEEWLIPVTGVLDIPMLGGALLDIKRNRQRLGGGSEPTLICPAGVLLENSDGELFQLQQISAVTGNYLPASRLPDSRDFVVRCDVMSSWAEPAPETQSAPAIKGAIKTKMPEPSNWKMRIQVEATAKCLRLYKAGANPTASSIKNDLATWCQENNVMTDTGIFPNAEYLRVHVLSSKHWKKPDRPQKCVEQPEQPEQVNFSQAEQ